MQTLHQSPVDICQCINKVIESIGVGVCAHSLSWALVLVRSFDRAAINMVYRFLSILNSSDWPPPLPHLHAGTLHQQMDLYISDTHQTCSCRRDIAEKATSNGARLDSRLTLQ